MRILHVMAGKCNGGAELYSTDVMLSLHEAGIDQCVSMRSDAPRAAILEQAGLRMAPQVLQAPLRALQRWRMRQLVEREKPDIIHCWMRRAASIVPNGVKKQIVVVGWFGDYEELRHFSNCTQFVGVTKDLVRHMQEKGIPPERTKYIPTFSSVEDSAALDRTTLDTPENAWVLLTLSRLHPTKGLDTLLRALPSLPDCYLWIAGDGPIRDELEALAAQLGITGRVRFLGWRTDRGALLRASDICLLPSRYEPFGTVILDAWSTQTAFIACASDGPRAYIRNGENGMLVPIDDVAALAHTIQHVIDHDDLRQKIITQGFAELTSTFNKKSVTDQYIEYYQRLKSERDFKKYRRMWLEDRKND